MQQNVWAPGHPNIATGLAYLADLYRAQNRYARAEPLYLRALTIHEEGVRPEHPDVAMSLDNHAALLRETGRESEATKMAVRAEAI